MFPTMIRRAWFAGKKAKATPWYLAGGISTSSCVAAYNPYGAANQAASYINVANPGVYNLTVPNAPTWAQLTGWTFDGAANYLATGIVPVKQLWTMIIRLTGLTQAANKYIAGCRNSSPLFHIGASATPALSYGSGASLLKNITWTSGVLAIAGNLAYRNGIQETGTIADNGTNMGTRDIYIGARNAEGNPSGYTAVTILAVAIYNVTLTQSQIASVGVAQLPLV